MRGPAAAWGAAWAAGAWLACASPTPPAMLDAGFPEGRRSQPLASLLEARPLAPEETFRVEELGRDAATSHHLVRIRGGEDPHRHDRHELVVVVLRGHGSLRLGESVRPVGPGSVLYVPRGVVHAFRNESGRPAVAYVIYVPPFDGTDRMPAD